MPPKELPKKQKIIRKTNAPEKQLKNFDIRRYAEKIPEQDNEAEDHSEPNINSQKSNKTNNNNRNQKSMQQVQRQMRITDTRLKLHIPKQKLGIWNFKPEDPEQFVKKLNARENQSRNSTNNQQQKKGKSSKTKKPYQQQQQTPSMTNKTNTKNNTTNTNNKQSKSKSIQKQTMLQQFYHKKTQSTKQQQQKYSQQFFVNNQQNLQEYCQKINDNSKEQTVTFSKVFKKKRRIKQVNQDFDNQAERRYLSQTMLMDRQEPKEYYQLQIQNSQNANVYMDSKTNTML